MPYFCAIVVVLPFPAVVACLPFLLIREPFSASSPLGVVLVGHVIPSPKGFPLAQKTGKGQSHLLYPKICYQFLSEPMS